MGWFWSDSSPARPAGPSPPSLGGASPPPGCPMHVGSDSVPPRATADPPPQSCPVRSPSQTEPTVRSGPSSTLSKLNPLNYMPSLSQDRARGQTIALPTSREASSIPRGDIEANWEYPSPQQMYNALLRKGFDDTPANAIESMVAVHNFLNEGAWQEILGWEARFARGLKHGWDNCLEGEERFDQKRMLVEARQKQPDGPSPKLLRLQGRPGDMTPKARILQVLGWAYPTRFTEEAPFDRHDWYVQRATPDGRTSERRYVIDYYSGPPEPTGEPVFFLDVRPAVDSPSQAAERLMRWGGDWWYRASGGETRVQSPSQ